MQGFLLLVILLISGCSGGTVQLVVTEISGPGSLDENQVADYSVIVTNGVNVEYAWSVEPASAGNFTNATSATVTFHAQECTVNTDIVITINITAWKAEPTIISRDVRIMDTNQAPIAAAHADLYRIGDGQQIQFFDDSTDPEGDDDIVQWEWDFDYSADDGFSTDSTLHEPRQEFDIPGAYLVQLRVTDTSEIVDLLDVALEVEIVENIAPVITQVNHDRTTSETGNTDEGVQLEVVFEDYTPPGGPHDIVWSCEYGYFDDYTSPTPIWYPPDAVVECDVNVEVIDEFGLTDTESIHQWVTQFPVVINSLAPGNQIIPQNLETTFDGTINPANWVFPNDLGYGNVIFMHFWASWSGLSYSTMPILQDVYNLYKNDEYYHLTINVSDEAADVSDFVILNSYESTYWPLDYDGSYFNTTRGWNEGEDEIAQYILFDRDGRCRWAAVGELTWTIELQLAIEQLL